jgi:hypothetical protein
VRVGSGERLDTVEVQLDGGQVAFLQVYRLDEADAEVGGGERDAARFPKPNFGEIAAAIREVATKVGGAVQSACPDSATVELAFAFAVKAGMATAMLVDGDTTASIKVTLTWTSPTDRSAAAAG